MANMTATTMASWLPEVWSKQATVTYRAECFLERLTDKRWEKELGVGKGDTVNIPAFSQNSGAVARSTFGTAAALSSELIATTESQVQLKVNKMAIYGKAVPAEDAVQAMPEYEDNLIEGIGTALRLYVDAQMSSDNTDGFDGFSTVVGTANVDITDDNIITCMTNLTNNNAPLKGRSLVVSPASYGSMLQIERLVNQLNKAAVGNINANKAQGFVGGSVYTFDVYVSNNLESGDSGKKNAAFQTEAIATCMQKNVTIEREPSVIDGLITYTAGYVVFGQKEVKDGFGNELDGK